MIITHECIKCSKGYVTYHTPNIHICNNCGYTEDDEQFWRNDKQAFYLRELEAEIDTRFPDTTIFLIGNTIELAIGYHAMGRIDARDSCMKAIEEHIYELYDNWSLCFCDFSLIEKRIEKYHSFIGRKDTEKYKAYIESLEQFFMEMPDYIKYLYKNIDQREALKN